jgi:toxin ParE1/3/4
MDKIEKICWTQDGIQSLEEVIEHIARDSQYYAGSFAKKILQCIENLTEFPLMGRVVPEYRDPQLRELIYQNYRIVYKIAGPTVYIALVIHGSHMLPDSLETH